ncbi:MAG: 3-dehydroquinate synthase [Bdellovibrionaceae bacterium]|nr:3-dehydroquinate synthase [Pseudobdellovibrionaceae bacterium]
MNSVFFSKKVPSVKSVLSKSYLNIKSDALVSSAHLKFYKNGIFQKTNRSSKQRSLSPQFKQALVICDKKFQSSPLLKNWKKNKQFKFYYLKSGEQSKSLECLPQHIKKINSLISDFDKSSLLFIGLGGGSIIDLTGFLASIYKRGIPVVFIPSTWLSALDSAHGGKNALNFKGIKNLLGTYHFPKAIYIIEELLKQNPKNLEQQAYGELLKIAFIKGGNFYKSLRQSILANFKNSNKRVVHSAFSIKKFLQTAIEAKMAIVKKDPFENKIERKKLNLGHTVGHVLEASQSLPHGIAVLYGLLFSLNWSYHKAFLSKKNYEEMKSLILLKLFDLSFTTLNTFIGINSKKNNKKLNKNIKKIPLSLFKSYLRQDKKHKEGFKIEFIFIQKPGKVFFKTVLEKELIQEAKRQSFL